MSSQTKKKPRQLLIVTPEEELENLRNEVGVLGRAVESKSAAVGILRAELQECQRERDKFRVLAEQGTLHRSSASSVPKQPPAYSDPCRSAMLSGSDGTLAQLLSQSKEENKMLRLDATELRCKLHDAQADIKVLREESQRLRGCEGRRQSNARNTTSQLAMQEREQFISQMEALSAKCQALEGDVRGLVEEREELVRELDASTHKLHRLNHILNNVLTSSSAINATTGNNAPKRIIDLDAIITENRYLQQRLKQTEEEKNLAKGNASKYKAALEKCRSQGSLKLGTSENLIVTPKQVRELVHDYRGEVGGAAESDLKSLCVALVDALNQRSRALRTQRAANKVLVGRVAELERRLSTISTLEDGQESESRDYGIDDEGVPDIKLASLCLMDGYTPPAGPLPKYSEVDTINDPRLARLMSDVLSKEDPSEKSSNDCVQGNMQSVITNNVDIDSHKENLNSEIANKTANRRGSKTSNAEFLSDGATDTKSALHTSEKNKYDNSTVCSVSHSKESNLPSSKNSILVKSTSVRSKDCISDCEENSSEERFKGTKTVGSITGKGSGIAGKSEAMVINGVPTGNDSLTYKKTSRVIRDDDDLEEIVPIDQLDSYIKEVQLKRRQIVKKSSNHLGSIKESDIKESGLKESDIKESVKKESGRKECDIQESNTNAYQEGKDSGYKLQPSDETRESSSSSGVDDKNGSNGSSSHEVQEESTYDNPDDCEGDDSSFDLDISDYDSDNDNLDIALQEWQNDFGKVNQGNDKKLKKNSSPIKSEKRKSSGKKEKFSLWRKSSSMDDDLPPALKELLNRANSAAQDGSADCT